jgi:hypothetical protein
LCYTGSKVFLFHLRFLEDIVNTLLTLFQVQRIVNTNVFSFLYVQGSTGSVKVLGTSLDTCRIQSFIYSARSQILVSNPIRSCPDVGL